MCFEANSDNEEWLMQEEEKRKLSQVQIWNGDDFITKNHPFDSPLAAVKGGGGAERGGPKGGE